MLYFINRNYFSRRRFYTPSLFTTGELKHMIINTNMDFIYTIIKSYIYTHIYVRAYIYKTLQIIFQINDMLKKMITK